ncbi:hypothetical protein [Paenibacillus eucommiae]|uniref:Uncharacterized protein n=1 Tax=Paenibacillus eucommiae TaxID=1355755 RepID=A0ABS4IMJ9_9BACL|nr:hypothetical protein [Paenibacillus eucommiae]MBP1988797.1 hypothetical protein [Paenibacillus eucommiae]
MATIARITRTPSSNGQPARVFLLIQCDFLAGADAGSEERTQLRRICYFNDVFHR